MTRLSFTRLRSLVAAAIVCTHAPVAAAQDSPFFAGGLFGVSVLSGDARAVTAGADAALSLYEPASGPALNLLGGAHLAEYFSVQVDWIWNRNDLTLVASSTAPAGGFYEQPRRSRQHAVVFDGLIYFRRRDSRVRPYLGTGLSILRFSSEPSAQARGSGIPPPAGDTASTHIGLRSHVGIDFKLPPRLAFRYSFSETLSANPIGPLLTPPGRRGLMNFQNLFGAVVRF